MTIVDVIIPVPFTSDVIIQQPLTPEEINSFVGMPTGGLAGQVLSKASGTDFDIEWIDVSGVQSPDWVDITNKPVTFTPSAHTHSITEVVGLQTTLDNKAPISHSHVIADVSGLQSALDGKSPTSHTHIISDVSGLQAALDGKFAIPTGDTTQYVAGDGSLVAFPVAVDARIASAVGTSIQAYDADLAAIAALTSNGLARKTGAGTWTIDTNSYLITNQTITFTGDATGSGSTAVSLTIPNDTISNAKLANMPANTLKGNNTGASADPADLTVAQVKTLLAYTAADVGAAATSHTHTLSNISDVTMTVANLNSLDDGVNTALHFHDSDRNRANHTGTQLAATISDFNTAADARVVAGITGKENTIAAGTTSQYWRGDKSWQTLDKSAVGLSNVDNTSDATKNSGSATLTNKTISGASNTITNIAQSSVTNLTTDLAGKQPLDGDLTSLAAASATNSLYYRSATDTWSPVAIGANISFTGGTLSATGGGGGASVGGTANEVQYNDGAGGFGGAANVQIDNGNLKLVSLASDPTAPTGGLLLYSKGYAGRQLPKMIGPSGIDTALQVGLHGNSVFMVGPASGTTAPTAWGGTLTTAATMSSQQTIASANRWLATYRKRFATSTTAGNTSGMRTAYAQWFLGNAAGFGGFFFRTQFGWNINLNGGQKFIGLCASTGALAGEPSALVNMLGCGWNSTDVNTGNLFFMRNDGTGTATKVDLGTGAARSNTTHGYELIMFAAPNSNVVNVFIQNLHTGTVLLDTTYNTDVPAFNTGMAFKCEVRNGAQAAADNIECAKVYIESDY